MKRLLLALVIGAGGMIAVAQTAPPPAIKPAAVQDDIAVFFSPEGDCMPAIVQQIAAARRSIEIQAFILSTNLISRPLIEAHERGVRVTVVFDAEQAKEEYSLDEALAKAGINVYYDRPSEEGSNHNKVILIDRRVLITGSFNFSRSAQEDNAENLLIIRNKSRILDAYIKDFERRKTASQPYEP